MSKNKLFANLCEAMLLEVSTTGDIIKHHAGGEMLLQQLHQKHGLLHDQPYQEVPRVSWYQVKNQDTTWLLLVGSFGVGAIKWDKSPGSYKAIVATRGEIESFTNDRSSHIIDFLKTRIGSIKKIYQGIEDPNGTRGKIVLRRAAQGSSVVGPFTKADLVKKFKPMFFKTLEQAKADIKGMLSHMLKNDAYKRARWRLEKIMKLESQLEALRRNEIPEDLETAVNDAIILAAKYFYPLETGNIRNTASRGYYTDNAYFMTKRIVDDIGQGDQKKLAAVIGFFKQRLIK